MEIKCQLANDQLMVVVATRGQKVTEVERLLKEVEGQKVKLDRVDGLIRCGLKNLEKKCVDPDKRKTLELFKVKTDLCKFPCCC